MFIGVVGTPGSATSTIATSRRRVIGHKIIAVESLIFMLTPCTKITNFFINASWELTFPISCAAWPTLLCDNNTRYVRMRSLQFRQQISSSGLYLTRYARRR